MKFWRGLAVTTTVIALAGCTSQRDQAQGGFEYVDINQRGALLVPEGMQNVAQNPDFSIPNLDTAQGPVGTEQSIRSPRQVMPLVPGSRVEEGSRDARIWFDAIEDMDDVAGWVWEEMQTLLAERDIEITEQSELEYIQTGTIETVEGSRSRGGFWARLRRDRIEQTSEYSLRIEMQAPSHGRSARLDVTAADVSWLEDGEPQEVPVSLQREVEAGFLNDLSLRMQRNFEDQRVAQVRATRALRHAESPQGDPAYALDVNFEAGWVLMPGALEYLGFEVEDLNQRDGVYYANYQPGGRPGFWSRLAFWSSEDRGLLGLPRGSGYEFQVDAVDDVFYIVIRHDDEVLDEETIDKLFPVFAEAFSEHAD
ncbi:hypothetical protein CWE12_02185 [Aliidiomarina sedimenti]|uniref:Outer membrane protein assembly factor BamC n=1 Tax=Aliidiomarina sedimenti TaxID=1933879 RepID=A0ABY0C1U6_9GAMM|nr:outer membrane protein assembly factor BamC [Aliidiomarina sedimenti]RUO31830.1 hypothetical protein CWE12_02185 [Aliidiomarina sedimenti]